jgi:hypothetical protein
MGRASVCCAHNAPFRVIPHFGKVTEDHGKSSLDEQRAVFHEDVSGSYLTDNSRHVLPQAGSLAVDSGSLACCTDVLAGKPSRNHVNTSAPWRSVKGANVIPNRERREKSVILSGGKNSGGVGFSFDGTDGAPTKQVSSENASTSAREKSQLIHGTSRQRCSVHFQWNCMSGA